MANHATPRKPLSRRERFDVLTRCNYACFYCGTPAQLGLVRLEIEHVVPVSQGGTNDPWNLVAACADCNSGKGPDSPSDALIAAAIKSYMAWPGRPGSVRLCATCQRPWVPEWDEVEPNDDCWPCIRAWVDGHYADRSWRGTTECG